MRYRWAILAAGTFAQATYTSIVFGLAVLAPALRSRYGLSLTQIGILLAAPNLGSILTLYLWGVATDRLGERVVVGAGLAGAAACMAFVAFAGSFAPLVTLLFLAGAVGASVNSASGRAVMHWFEASGRGLALGVRQTAVPISGAYVALVLPILGSEHDPRPALIALALGCLAGGVIGLVVLREGPHAGDATVAPVTRAPLRDRGMWLLSAGSALMLAPQVCLVGFLVVFLHEQRDLSTSAAAAILAVVNILAIGTRIGVGRWSDLVGSRIPPLRRIALASVVLVLLCTLLESGPLAVLVPALVVMGCVSISWNSLSFAAAAEAAGHARSGTAIGLQQTALAVSGGVLPIAFGALVGLTSWRLGFAAAALLPLVGWRLLATVPG